MGERKLNNRLKSRNVKILLKFQMLYFLHVLMLHSCQQEFKGLLLLHFNVYFSFPLHFKAL